MNWLKRIQSLLGSFWSRFFGAEDFIHGVENLLAMYGKKVQGKADKTAASQIAADTDKYDDKMPFVIYLLKAQQFDDGMHDMVEHPITDLDDQLEADTPTLHDDPDGGWLLKLRFVVPSPLFMADHVIDYTKTLFNGVDYEFYGDSILLYADPASLNLMTHAVTDSKGKLSIYYKLFGWAEPELAYKDMVCSFESKELNDMAELVWSMHQNGVSVYDAKQLLAGVSDSVVCRKGGVVTHWWTEQDIQCMLVNDEDVYYAPSTATRNYNHGDNVETGAILFGSLIFIDGKYAASTDAIPGIRVQTDTGELLAHNVSMALDDDELLPLRDPGTNLASAEYAARCRELAQLTDTLKFELPNPVNPYLFIMRNIRCGKSVHASLMVSDPVKFAAAIAVLRRCTDAGSVIDIYAYAPGDTVNIQSSFTADAGMAAVAVDATITLQAQCAEAGAIL